MWKIILMPVGIIAGVLFLWYLQTPAPQPGAGTTNIDWTPLVYTIGVAVVIATLGVAIYFGNSALATIGKGLGVGTLGVVAALLFLEWTLYRYVPAMHPMFEGPGWIFFTLTYVVAIIILAVINEHAKGMQWFFGIAAMAVALTLIGTKGDPIGWWDRMTSNTFTRTVSVPATPGWILGQPQTLAFGPTLTMVSNPAYQLRGRVLRGCVSWYNAGGYPLAHTCEGDMPSVPGITSLRADGSAVVTLNHCRPWTPGNLLDVCG